MIRFFCIAGVALAACTLSAQNNPSPVMEYSSLLSSLDVSHDGRLEVEDPNAAVTTVFQPDGAKLELAIVKAGSDAPVHVQPFLTSESFGVFRRAETRSLLKTFHFTEPGQFTANYRINGVTASVVPFRVDVLSNDDQFNPIRRFYLSGPWSDWAYLFASVKSGEDATPQFRMWAQKRSFEDAPGADVYTLEVRYRGDVVAIANKGFCSSAKWQRLNFDLKQPESQGGLPLKIKDLAARDGDYEFVVHKNDQPHAVFPLAVAGGKPKFHPQQASDYQPRSQYLVPRFPGLLMTRGQDSAGHTFWMRRLDDEAAKKALETSTQKVAGPSDDDLRRWHWLPRSIDPNRPFQLAITEVATRSDTMIATGEDLIVFGTGFPNGVKYLKVGDSQATEIPEGDTFSSRLFWACGKKIILTRKTQVGVFDTESGSLHMIPESEISLYNPVGGLHGGCQLKTDGYLVATINRATQVADHTILKVIDVSGDSPVIIPIKNADYLDRDVSSVDVDAEHGVVAVSSQAKKLVAAAVVAPFASQQTFDLADQGGVGKQQIFVEDDWITYADDDQKIRVLKLESGASKAVTDVPFASSGNGFAVRKGRVAVAMPNEKVGSRYKFAVGDLDDSPSMIPGTGEPIESTSASLGMAGCAAIAIDKTVFLAGTPGGGIGVGERLQVLTDNKWTPVTDSSGNAIPAIDVTTSMGLLAFKTADKAGKVVVGYATYGQNVNYQPVAIPLSDVGQNAGGAKPEMKPETTTPAKGLTEIEQAFLKAMLEQEDQLIEAFTPAFGENGAKQKIAEGYETTLKNSDQMHLLDELKKRSKVYK